MPPVNNRNRGAKLSSGWLVTRRSTLFNHPFEEVSAMARIGGAQPSRQGLLHGLLTRVVYGLTRRKVGRVVMPVRLIAHHPKLLWGYGQMEQAFVASRLVAAGLKTSPSCVSPRSSAALFELTSVLRSAERGVFRRRRSTRYTTTEPVRCSRKQRNWFWNTPMA
jgi:hypothetical protein